MCLIASFFNTQCSNAISQLLNGCPFFYMGQLSCAFYLFTVTLFYKTNLAVLGLQGVPLILADNFGESFAPYLKFTVSLF